MRLANKLSIVLVACASAAQAQGPVLGQIPGFGPDLAFDWQAEPTAVEYRVYRLEVPACAPPSLLATTPTTSVTLLGELGDSSPAVYAVAAFDGTVEGPLSVPIYKYARSVPADVVTLSLPHEIDAGFSPDSRGLCDLLNQWTAQVDSLSQLIPSSGTFRFQACGVPISAFAHVPGDGYVANVGAAGELYLYGFAQPEWNIDFTVPGNPFPDEIGSQMVSLPLDHGYSSLSDIAAELPEALDVMLVDPLSLDFFVGLTRPTTADPWSGPDLPISEPGEAVKVKLASPGSWLPTRMGCGGPAGTLKLHAAGADVVLRWDSGAPNQEILRGTAPGGPFMSIGQSDTGSYADAGALAGPPTNPDLYAYQIEDAGPMPMVTHLLAVQALDDVILYWGLVGTDVEVLRADNPLGPFSLLTTSSTGTATDLGAVSGAPFYVYMVRTAGPGPAAPTNLAFKLDYTLQIPPPPPPPPSGWHLVAAPYLFFPNGDVADSTQTAEDWCSLLNGDPAAGSPIASISQYQPASDSWLMKQCSAIDDGFDLRPGEGYSLALDAAVTSPLTIALVGSHDNRYAPNKGGTLTHDLTFSPVSFGEVVAVPYHITAITMLELCTMVNGGPMMDVPLSSVSRHDASTDTFTVKACASPFPGGALTPGDALVLRPGGSMSQMIAFDVY